MKRNKIVTSISVFLILTLFAGMSIASSCDSDSDENGTKTTTSASIISNDETDSSDESDKTEDIDEIENTDETEPSETTEITYTKYKTHTLFNDLSDNALAAERKHQDEYVEITGYIDTIDSDGKYITIGCNDKNYEHSFDSIMCEINSEEQLDVVASAKKGKKVVVKGQITSIGEILGYTVSMDSITIAKKK